MISDERLIDWLCLARSLPLGGVAFSVLRRMCDTPKQMLSYIPKIVKRSSSRYGQPLYSMEQAIAELNSARLLGAAIITFEDDEYPELLRTIRCAPPVLTVIGDVSVLVKKSVAIVGSRNASTNSLRFAKNLSEALSAAGYVIVSGLARGVDTVAHGIVNSGGLTVAVMASGIDVVYPSSNQDLYAKISKSGAVVTEAALGTAPKGCLFPQRNRIISGLSAGVVVVEASATSGSLITAKFALAQGREVFAVPGFPMDPRYGGNIYLLKEGANIVETADDVIQLLDNSPLVRSVYEGSVLSENKCSSFIMLSVSTDENRRVAEAKNRIIGLLDDSPVGVDEIMSLMSKYEADEMLLMEALMELELSDMVERHPGNKLSLLL